MRKNRRSGTAQATRSKRVRTRPRREQFRLWAKRILLTAGITVLCLLLATVGLDLWRFILSSPRFAVTNIDVRGAETVNQNGIMAGSGIRFGQSIFTIDLAESVATLEIMPHVKTAHIERHFPDRVTITVAERQPIALVTGNGLYEMDSEGVVIARAGGRSASMPVITGLVEHNFFPGLNMTDELTQDAARLMTAFCTSALNKRLRISEIDVSDAANITVLLADPPAEIRCGRGEYSDKFRKLEIVMDDLLSREHPLDNLEYVDMRFGDIIPVKFGEG